ncbi:MAG TPA: hypothetical protein VHV49_17595 [Pseudonocardiaceae bacterium]|nr:hypothetical protein [Pseudonocardiaceae bacterium]
MSRITADPGWLPGYAATVDQAADDLAAVLAMVSGSSLTESSFGDLGREADVPAAYSAAAATLRQRLSEMVDALHAVAAGIDPAAGPERRG